MYLGYMSFTFPRSYMECIFFLFSCIFFLFILFFFFCIILVIADSSLPRDVLQQPAQCPKVVFFPLLVMGIALAWWQLSGYHQTHLGMSCEGIPHLGELTYCQNLYVRLLTPTDFTIDYFD